MHKKQQSSPTVLYIVGRGHSGSTLLELLLNRNAGIAAMGELSLFSLQLSRDNFAPWVGQCSCGERLGECTPWSTIIGKVNAELGFDLRRRPFAWKVTDVSLEEDYGWRRPLQKLMYMLGRVFRRGNYRLFGKPTRLYKFAYQQWFHNRGTLCRLFAEEMASKVVIDASKDPLDMLDTYFLSGLEVKILFITRDVRGVAASSVKRNRASAGREATQWVSVNARILRALRYVNSRDWMQIRYEDLCEDTGRILGDVAEFSGVSLKLSSAAEERKSRHTVAGNGLRFQEITTVSTNENWRSILSDYDLVEIEKAAGECSSRLGYQLANNACEER